MSEPPGSCEKPKCRPRRANWTSKFVERVVAEDGVVLSDDGEIAILIYARAGSRVLSEDLIL